MSEIKNSVVLLIDDDDRELKLVSKSLNDAVHEKGFEVTIESYQIFADNSFDDKIDGLMEKIKAYTASEQIKRVVLAIDLHLMGTQSYTSFDKLLSDAETGLMVKKYIARELAQLSELKEQTGKVKYLFISNYLKAGTEIGVTLGKMLLDEKELGVAKPGKNTKTQELLINEGCDKKECKLQDEKLKNIIQGFYNVGTTYDNLIGTILEIALS